MFLVPSVDPWAVPSWDVAAGVKTAIDQDTPVSSASGIGQRVVADPAERGREGRDAETEHQVDEAIDAIPVTVSSPFDTLEVKAWAGLSPLSVSAVVDVVRIEAAGCVGSGCLVRNQLSKSRSLATMPPPPRSGSRRRRPRSGESSKVPAMREIFADENPGGD